MNKFTEKINRSPSEKKISYWTGSLQTDEQFDNLSIVPIDIIRDMTSIPMEGDPGHPGRNNEDM